MGSRTAALKELTRVPGLIVILWTISSLAVVFGETPAGMVYHTVSGVVGASAALFLRPRVSVSWSGTWFRLVLGVAAVTLGAAALWATPVELAWIGLGTVLIGVHAVAWALSAGRTIDVSDAGSRLEYRTLQRALAALDAEDPTSVETLADELGVSAHTAREAVAILHWRGDVEPHGDGYVANNPYLGRRFSLRGFVRRLSRPFRIARGTYPTPRTAG